MSFPQTFTCKQRFPRPRLDSIEAEVQRLGHKHRSELPDWTGKKVSVAVGSRGIANLAQIVKAVVKLLLDLGSQPQLVPAMGSHGGGTATGQAGVLAQYGVTAETMGVPLRATMETVGVGETLEGVPVEIDREAFESDGIVVINRVKPHTDFSGEVESGMLKMMAVGLGNRQGADSFHSFTLSYPYDQLILSKARVLLSTAKVGFGLGIIENAYHETARLELLPAGRLVDGEKALLVEARRLMPSLPVESLDILVIDRIGKDISGAGLDPNVTGRRFLNHSRWQDKPDIHRIVVLGLSEKTQGNAIGIGLADFTTERLVHAIDRSATYLNLITSRNIVAGNIPPYFDSDQSTLKQAMASLASGIGAQEVRLMRIRDTLNLGQLEASWALREELQNHSRIEEFSPLQSMRFGAGGEWLPSWERSRKSPIQNGATA